MRDAEVDMVNEGEGEGVPHKKLKLAGLADQSCANQ
jgi:hypothetical protein